MEYTDGHLSLINANETDETGDWTVYDTYSVDSSGRFVKLSRTINVIPGDSSVVQTYTFQHGKTNKLSATAKALGSGKPKSLASVDWIPDLPIATSIQALPFSSLVSLSTPLTRDSRRCSKISSTNH